MKSQIFKEKVPKSDFYEFIKNITSASQVTINGRPHYAMDHACYKKSVYTNEINTFIDKIRPYYHISKVGYINKENMNYKKCNTIIRQICKSNEIELIKEIKYDKSKYSIIYYIHSDSNINVIPN